MSRLSDPIWSFFDLDGTLIKRDSYLPFLLKWKCWYPRRFRTSIFLPFKLVECLNKHRGRSCIKEALLTAFMQGARRSDISNFVQQFWDQFLPKHQNDEVVKQLDWHHNSGHNVYIVTGSFDFYAQYLKSIWPVDGVIATRAEWAGELLTGKISGKNCKGNEKVRRIEKELKIDLQETNYYVYTDSDRDFPLLKNATYPIRVQSKKFRPLTCI